MALSLFIYWLVQLYILRDFKAKRKINGVDSAPNSTVSWILQAARESIYNRAQHLESTTPSIGIDRAEVHEKPPVFQSSQATMPQTNRESGFPSSIPPLPEKPRELVHWAYSLETIWDGQVVKLKKL